MEGNVQVTPVGGRRVLAVADQIAFFLVAKHVPGNGDKVSATLEIDHPVVGPIKIAMINPDVMAAGFNADVIPAVFVVLTGRIEHPQVAELQVANDDVLPPGRAFPDAQSAAPEGGPVLGIDRFMRVHQNLSGRIIAWKTAVGVGQRGEIDVVQDFDHQRLIALQMSGQIGQRRDVDMLAARPSGGAVPPQAVHGGKANEVKVRRTGEKRAGKPAERGQKDVQKNKGPVKGRRR